MTRISGINKRTRNQLFTLTAAASSMSDAILLDLALSVDDLAPLPAVSSDSISVDLSESDLDNMIAAWVNSDCLQSQTPIKVFINTDLYSGVEFDSLSRVKSEPREHRKSSAAKRKLDFEVDPSMPMIGWYCVKCGQVCSSPLQLKPKDEVCDACRDAVIVISDDDTDRGILPEGPTGKPIWMSKKPQKISRVEVHQEQRKTTVTYIHLDDD